MSGDLTSRRICVGLLSGKFVRRWRVNAAGGGIVKVALIFALRATYWEGAPVARSRRSAARPTMACRLLGRVEQCGCLIKDRVSDFRRVHHHLVLAACDCMQGTAGPVVHPVLDTDRVNNGFFAAKKSDAGKVWRGLQAESVHFAQRRVVFSTDRAERRTFHDHWSACFRQNRRV